MRRIIFASAAAAVLACNTGCQQCWDSFRRFEAWKFQTVFGRSPGAYEQVVAMPATVAAPICQPIDVYAPAPAVAVPAGVPASSPGCPCSESTLTAVPSLTVPTTTFGPATSVTPIPGPSAGIPAAE